jgi:hypothetical protein
VVGIFGDLRYWGGFGNLLGSLDCERWVSAASRATDKEADWTTERLFGRVLALSGHRLDGRSGRL